MNVIFMGTPDFAVPSLEALSSQHDIAAVVTQPDRPKGRGNKVQPTPVKAVAEAHGIPVYQPERIRRIEDILKQAEADIFVVVAYGQILPERILNIPRYGCINAHGSILPKYRGAAPMQWALINGETETGITVMQMYKGIDTGDILLQNAICIEPEDNFGTLHDKMAKLSARSLLEALEAIENKTVIRKQQESALASHAPMITKETCLIDWTKPAYAIANLVRGLNPFPGAYTYLTSGAGAGIDNAERVETMLKVWRGETISGYKSASPGEIIDVIKERGIVVDTGDGALLVTEVQAQGGKKMSMQDFMRGHRIFKGDAFISL